LRGEANRFRAEANRLSEEAAYANERANEFREEANALRQQANTFREEANLVAKDAAKAAQANVETQVNKERARIRIVLEKINPTWTGSGFNGVTCWLTNYGPTAAFIDDFRGRLLQVHVAEEPIVLDYAQCRDILYAESLQSTGRTASFVIPLEPNANLTEDEVMSIRKGQAFIHFYGFVKYRDVFDRSRRQTIHMRWTMRWGGMIEGQIMQWWDPVGSPAENRDTEEQNLS